MRGRGMRRSSRRAGKQPSQWFNVPDSATTVGWSGISGRGVAAATVDRRLILDATTPSGLDPAINRFRIDRIRGQLIIQSNDAVNSGLWQAGIIMMNSNAPDAVPQVNVSSSVDSVRSWMWLRSGFLAGATNGSILASNAQDGMNGCELDIKVKRIVHPDDMLIWCFEAQRAVLVAVNLRVLITRVA